METKTKEYLLNLYIQNDIQILKVELSEIEDEDIKNDIINTLEVQGDAVEIDADSKLELHAIYCEHCLRIYYYLAKGLERFEILEGEGFETDSNGVVICGDCRDYYMRCESCDEFVEENSIYIAHCDGDECFFCESCFDRYTWRCACCGEHYSDNQTYYRLGNDERVCDACYSRDESIAYCEYCDERYFVDDMVYNDDLETYICEHCDAEYKAKHQPRVIVLDSTRDALEGLDENYLNDTNGNGSLNPWHNYRRAFNYIFMDSDSEEARKLLIGAELEITDLNYNIGGREFESIINHIHNNYDAIVASDGSLNGHGMEIISDAQTLGVWEYRRPRMDALFKNLVKTGFRSDEGNTQCGLHFHVSREYLGDTKEEQEDTIARVELILENFKNELMRFSRRDSESVRRYASFISDRLGQKNFYSLDLIKEHKNDNLDGGARYQALNITNDKTIEFRFFKGTLNIETFYASLYLVKNIIDLAKDREHYAGATWAQLIKKGNYADLIEYNKKRGIISKSRLKDWTHRLRIERMKKDSKELKRYNRQSKAIIAYIEMIKQYDALIAEAELYYSINHNSSVFDNFKRIFNGLSSEYGVGTYDNARINYMLEVVRVMYKVNEFLTFRYSYKTTQGTFYKLLSDSDFRDFKQTARDLENLLSKGGV